MAVFGGIHLDDLWLYYLAENRWVEVEQSKGGNPGGLPGKRHGHAAVADSSDSGFYVFGGFRFADDTVSEIDESGPLSDLWHVDIITGTWTHLLVAHPKEGRTYASLVLHNNFLILFAGANCHGSCVCYGDLWEYPVDGSTAAAWKERRVLREPTTRYKQTAVLHNDHLYTFGGESYKPYMYHNSVSRIFLGDAPTESTTAAMAKLAVAGLGIAAVAFAVVNHLRAQRRGVFKAR